MDAIRDHDSSLRVGAAWRTRGSPDLVRTPFAMPRAAEFLEVRALQTQTGQPREHFGSVVLKELLDNALDAAESHGLAPSLDVSLDAEDAMQYLTVADNGAGIPADVIEQILNFNVLVSDKAAYPAAAEVDRAEILEEFVSMPPLSWTAAVEQRVRARLSELDAEICERVRAWLAERGGGGSG